MRNRIQRWIQTSATPSRIVLNIFGLLNNRLFLSRFIVNTVIFYVLNVCLDFSSNKWIQLIMANWSKFNQWDGREYSCFIIVANQAILNAFANVIFHIIQTPHNCIRVCLVILARVCVCVCFPVCLVGVAATTKTRQNTTRHRCTTIDEHSRPYTVENSKGSIIVQYSLSFWANNTM